MHQRPGAQRLEAAYGLPGIWHPMPAGDSHGRPDGIGGRRVLGLLSLPADGMMEPGFTCPLPFSAGSQVLLGHGSGGKLSAELIRDVFLAAFRNPILERMDDQAVVS